MSTNRVEVQAVRLRVSPSQRVPARPLQRRAVQVRPRRTPAIFMQRSARKEPRPLARPTSSVNAQ